MDFASSAWEAENKTKGIVAKSSVVSQLSCEVRERIE